jgi:hypothetical protein
MTTSKKIHRKSIISFGVPAILQVPQMIFRIFIYFLGGKLLIAVNSHMQRNGLFMILSCEFHDVLLKGEMGSSE